MRWCGAQVAKLRAYHYTAQTKPEKAGLNRYGLDLIKGALRNNVEAGVLEPELAKVKIIQVSITMSTLLGTPLHLLIVPYCKVKNILPGFHGPIA